MRTPGLLAAAALSYTANCLLGTAVATRTAAVRTNATTDARWVHHALYLTTSVLTVSATVALLLGPPEGAKQGRAGWFLLPALAPLAAIPFLGSSAAHRRRHTLVALIPAPFYAMSAFSAASVLNKKRSS